MVTRNKNVLKKGMQIWMHDKLQTYTDRYAHIYIYIHTHTCIHYIHTYMYIDIYKYAQRWRDGVSLSLNAGEIVYVG